jgi:hypothetical protein
MVDAGQKVVPSSSFLLSLSVCLPDVFFTIAMIGADVKRIVNMSRVCKTWRCISKDANVWKALCVHMWGNEGIHALRRQYVLCGSWRGMYVNRPRVRTDGVYVHKWVQVRLLEFAFFFLVCCGPFIFVV